MFLWKKKPFQLLQIIALFLLAMCSKESEKVVEFEPLGFKPINAFTQNAQLGRGVNLGNALEAPKEGDWGVVLRDRYFNLIKNAGFNTVRIPIRWSAHALEGMPFTIDNLFFYRVDWAVEQALKNGLNAIINMHHYDGIMSDPNAHKKRFLALWKQIAEHYKNYSANLVFEILNEPHDNLKSSLWNELAAETIDTIRLSNPERNLIVGPADWNGIGALPGLKLPAEDEHLIVTVHYYNPFHFTHQGAGWVDGSDKWLGTTWRGTQSERKAVNTDLDQAASWAAANNRPILLGEFGAYSKADIVSRALWTDFVARQCEVRKIPEISGMKKFCRH